MANDITFNADFERLIEPFHKGLVPENKSFNEIFFDRLSELGITQSRAEDILSIEKKSLNSILNNDAKRVDIVTILKLSQFLNIEVDNIVKLYLHEIPSNKIGEIEQTRKSSYIVENFDLPQLAKQGLISSKTDYIEIEKRLLRFFGYSSIFDYSLGVLAPAFSKVKRNASDQMREFWVKSAFAQFEKISNENKYIREDLIDLIPKIRPYTRNLETGLLTVIKALYHCGVTVIYQPNLTNVSVRGATMVVNKKPCIVLTDNGKRYPTLWFALMHELHHVLYDFDELSKRTFHITGDPDLFLIQEDKADSFAREYLFGSEKSKYIKPFINEPFLVNGYASKHQVHPSLIYNFYCWDESQNGDKYVWSRYSDMFPDINIALNKLNLNPFDKETLDETVELIMSEVFN